MLFFNESLPLLFMAIALSMDAFSVSLGLGMQPLRLRRIFFIGLVFGLFHMMFPIIGIILGKLLSDEFGQVTIVLSGLLLIFVGCHMFFSAFHIQKDKNKRLFNHTKLGIIILAITVSVDSAPVGLSLGITGVKTVIALMLFGIFSTLFTWTGLLIGRKVTGFLDSYSELLGGSILLSFGLYILFFS